MNVLGNGQKSAKARSHERTTEKLKNDQRMRKSTATKIEAAKADRKNEVAKAGHEKEHLEEEVGEAEEDLAAESSLVERGACHLPGKREAAFPQETVVCW